MELEHHKEEHDHWSDEEASDSEEEIEDVNGNRAVILVYEEETMFGAGVEERAFVAAASTRVEERAFVATVPPRAPRLGASCRSLLQTSSKGADFEARASAEVGLGRSV